MSNSEGIKALDYLEDRISHILRGEPVRDLDEALLHLRAIIEGRIISEEQNK